MLTVVRAVGTFSAELHGVVRDTQGQPLAQATIQVSDRLGYYHSSAASGTNGTYALELEPGVWWVELFTSPSSACRATPRQQIVLCAELELNFEVDRYQFSQWISGRVTSGLPWSGWISSVNAFIHDNGRLVAVSTNLDPFGEFSLPAFPGVWRLSVDEFNFAESLGVSLAVEVPAESNAVVTIPIQSSGRRVSGIILDASSNSIPYQSIRATTETEGGAYQLDFRADAFGQFSTWLFDGDWTFKFAAPPDFASMVQTFSVSSGNTNLVLQQLPPASAPNPTQTTTWGGYVTDELGLPLTNLMVSNSSTWTSSGTVTNTDQNGAFLFVLAEGQYSILFSAGTNFISPSFTINADTNVIETNVHAVLRRAASQFQIQVEGKASQPVIDAKVTASAFTNGFVYRVNARTDCAGRAAISAFPGEWLVSIESPTLTNRVTFPITRFVSLNPGQNTATFSVPESARDVELRGTVVDEQGHSTSANISYAWCGQPIRLGSFNEPLFVTSQGSFSKLLVPGRGSLSMAANDISQQFPIDIPSGTMMTNVTCVLRRGTNTVFFALTNVTENDFVSLQATTTVNGTNYSASTSINGPKRCSLNLFNGEWEVSAYSFNGSEYLYSQVSITVSGVNENIELPPLAPQPGETTLIQCSGSVLDEKTNSFPFAMVNFTPAHSDGTFAIGVPPGLSLQADHPLLPLTAVVARPTHDTNSIKLVIPNEWVRVECAVMDPDANLVPAMVSAYSSPQPANIAASSLPLENLHSLLCLPRGEWRIWLDDLALNGRGLQSQTYLKVRIDGPTNLVFAVPHITSTGRRPKLESRIENSKDLVLELKSEVLAEYEIQESTDLIHWSRSTLVYTTGGLGTALVPFSGQSSLRFYRAVWLRDYDY